MVGNQKQFELLISSREFFSELIDEAKQSRNLKLDFLVKEYLVSLLNQYIPVSNFSLSFDQKSNVMLAEVLLRASLTEKNEKIGILKKLGDMSLYVSGFFGDSLKRKIIDVDYYAEIGGSAYSSLAHEVDDEDLAFIYDEFSQKFLEFVDLLTLISQKSMVQTNTDLLRLYDRYISTGSKLAKEQLIENGLLTTDEVKKASGQ